jgi:hypothetical protein
VDEAWLDTVRIARDCGNISSLFPPGIARIWDLPHTIHRAIRMALYFISFENIVDKQDKPPKHIWLDGERMDAWWAAVEQRQGGIDRDVAQMPQNEALKEMFPGMTFS